MMNLIKLELKKNNIRTYITAALWITVAMIGFVYLFAAMPHIETGDPDMTEFSSYASIVSASVIINTAAFCVLSAVIHARFVIEEYHGSRAIQLFSYPVNRKKLFLSKIVLISVCTMAGLIISNLVIFSVFLGTEAIFPLVGDHISPALIAQLLLLTLIAAILSAAIGVISMTIGFHKKSSAAAIVSSIVLIAVISSAASNLGVSMAVIMAVVLLIAVFLIKVQMKKVQCMEV